MGFLRNQEGSANVLLCQGHKALLDRGSLHAVITENDSRCHSHPITTLLNFKMNNHLLTIMKVTMISTGADPGFGQGGPQLLRPKVADIAKWSHASEASILQLGSRARLRALEAFGFLMLKYAFSHILETLFLLFLTSILTPKVDKNRALDFTSINLRHSDMLHLFFNLHEKVML